MWHTRKTASAPAQQQAIDRHKASKEEKDHGHQRHQYLKRSKRRRRRRTRRHVMRATRSNVIRGEKIQDLYSTTSGERSVHIALCNALSVDIHTTLQPKGLHVDKLAFLHLTCDGVRQLLRECSGDGVEVEGNASCFAVAAKDRSVSSPAPFSRDDTVESMLQPVSARVRHKGIYHNACYMPHLPQCYMPQCIYHNAACLNACYMQQGHARCHVCGNTAKY